MANAICRASGCNDEVTRGQFTRYCAKHHRALYRHGHTHGNALSKRELSFYRKLVRTKRKATKDAQFWVECETRWLATIRKAQIEPLRVDRRLFCLSHAAMSGCSVTA